MKLHLWTKARLSVLSDKISGYCKLNKEKLLLANTSVHFNFQEFVQMSSLLVSDQMSGSLAR